MEIFDKLFTAINPIKLTTSKMSRSEILMLALMNAPLDELYAVMKKYGVPMEGDVYEAGNLFKVPLQRDAQTIAKVSSLFKSEGVSDKELTELAQKMIDMYPKGKKPGTNFYWRSNVKDIKSRLLMFYKTYGMVAPEEVIDALERYLKAYEDDDKYMQLLKYFIIKRRDAGFESRMYDMIVNVDDEVSHSLQDNYGVVLFRSTLKQ